MSKDRKPHGGAASEELSWKAIAAVSDVPPTGRHVELRPDAPTRAAIARLAGVVAVPRLEASFDLALAGADSLRVTGRVTGAVEQNCVVTLEPMTSDIAEDVDLLFTPPRDLPKATGPVDDDAEAAGSPAVDAPEELDNGTVDLAALTLEFLILGIDPFPRKPGAVFEAPQAGEPAPHPFAALAALKKDR
jgi:uncharacterized metal-binding protein YceD (DUF177 family)